MRHKNANVFTILRPIEASVPSRAVLRPDDDDVKNPRGRGAPSSGRDSPAGASPVRVGDTAPGSRPQARGEIPAARAGRQKPARRSDACNGEQVRGPQHQVKPAAATDEQCERRAEHVTAKATPSARAEGLARVWGAAREQGASRNRRGPSAPPSSGQDRAYKPKAKSRVVQRESEGIVVPHREASAGRTNAVKNNAAGGKGPGLGHARGEGKPCAGNPHARFESLP